jgi:hypothetical protein
MEKKLRFEKNRSTVMYMCFIRMEKSAREPHQHVHVHALNVLRCLIRTM